MDEFRNFINAIGAMAEMVVIFRNGLRNQGVPDDEAIRLTQAFLHEILSLHKNKEDN